MCLPTFPTYIQMVIALFPTKTNLWFCVLVLYLVWQEKSFENSLTILHLGGYVTLLRKLAVIPYKVLLYIYLFSLRFLVSIQLSLSH
jgi:hypothetical protein